LRDTKGLNVFLGGGDFFPLQRGKRGRKCRLQKEQQCCTSPLDEGKLDVCCQWVIVFANKEELPG